MIMMPSNSPRYADVDNKCSGRETIMRPLPSEHSNTKAVEHNTGDMRIYEDKNIFIFLVFKESVLKENLLAQKESFMLIFEFNLK